MRKYLLNLSQGCNAITRAKRSVSSSHAVSPKVKKNQSNWSTAEKQQTHSKQKPVTQMLRSGKKMT